MANDFQKKEPTKNEKMIYELYMQMQSMEKGLWSTSSLVIVMAMLTKQDPQAVAELLVNGDEKIRDFSKQINDAIKVLEEKKHDHSKPENEPAPAVEATIEQPTEQSEQKSE